MTTVRARHPQPHHLSLAAACCVLAVVALWRVWGGISPHYSAPLIPVLVLGALLHCQAHLSPGVGRGTCVAGALLAFSTAALVAASFGWIGFPDGFRTPFDVALRGTLPLFVLACCVFGSLHLWCALGEPARRKRWSRVAAVGWVLLLAAALLAEGSLLLVLDHGQGG